jgi:hypothetical protein
MMDVSPDENESAAPNTGPARAVHRVMKIGAGLNIGLVVYGAIRFPSAWRADPDGVCAGIGIMTVYALIGWFGAPATGRLDPAILRLALWFGAAFGGIFAISMLTILPLAARPAIGRSAGRLGIRVAREYTTSARFQAPLETAGNRPDRGTRP